MVTLGQYCDAWRRVKTTRPGCLFKGSLCCAFHLISREEILREFSDGTNDRLNRHLPWWSKGRKWSDSWQTETQRTAQQLNHPRMRIYWLPPWLEQKFAHRIVNLHED
jgi:hypothetical protein